MESINPITYIRGMYVLREKITAAITSNEFKLKTAARLKLSMNMNIDYETKDNIFDFPRIEYDPEAAIAQYFLNYTGGAYEANSIRNCELALLRLCYTELFEFVYIIYRGQKQKRTINTGPSEVKYNSDRDLLTSVSRYTNPREDLGNDRANKLKNVEKLYADIISLCNGDVVEFPKYDDDYAEHISEDLREYIKYIIKQSTDDINKPTSADNVKIQPDNISAVIAPPVHMQIPKVVPVGPDPVMQTSRGSIKFTKIICDEKPKKQDPAPEIPKIKIEMETINGGKKISIWIFE